MKRQFLAILVVLVCMSGRAEVVVRVVTNEVGVPQIRVNGKVVRPRMFWGWRGDVLYDQVRLAASNGVEFVSFMAERSAWRGEDDYDWSEVDAKSDAILSANPRALLIPRMKLDASGWWARKHPDDVVTFGDGTRADFPSVSCRSYRRQACAFIAALVRHLCERYPDNFAGIHPSAQSTCEFFYPNAWDKPWCGYDPGTREAFKAWRMRQGRPAAEVPTLAERRRDPLADPPLADPVRDGVLVDFRRFQQEEMADFVAEVCSVSRRASGGKKLVLGFYGYQWTFSRILHGPAASGHYALQRLLDRAAADIDILCSPIDYVDRGWGGVGHVMSAAETAMRHGVLWLMEDDTRTHVVSRDGCMGCSVICGDLEQSQQVLRRNMAQHILRGFGSWWMDLGSSGWYADPKLWKVMAEEASLDRDLLERKLPFAPEVAAIVDEESMLYLSLGRISRHVVSDLRLALGRGGAPYGQYLLSDVLRNPLAARLQFFQSAWYLTDEQRAQLRAQRAARPGMTRVWSWAPGYLSPKGKDVGGIERLTGFKAKLLPPISGRAIATEEGLRHGLPKSWDAGAQEQFVGLVGVEASEVETWARFEDGTTAVAVRSNGKGGHEVFLGSPSCPVELVRALENLAGVHRYVKTGDAGAFAAEGVLSVYAGTAGGAVTLDTGRAEPVVDVLTGRQAAVGPVFTLKMAPGECRVLRFSTELGLFPSGNVCR